MSRCPSEIWLNMALSAVHAFYGRKEDLADAGIDYTDDTGRVFDFHALRGKCATMLAASGTHPKIAQTILRHSGVNLTLNSYTHVLMGQESEAIASLPDLSVPNKQEQVAMGTNGKSDLASGLPILGDKRLPTVDNHGQKRGSDAKKRISSKRPLERKKTALRGSNAALPKEGLEPSPCCQDGILNPARLPIPPLRPI